MEYLDIRKHKLNKLIKDGEIGVHKNEKSRNEFSRAEIEKYKDEHGDSLKPTVDSRNNLNYLTGKEWLPETKSFWYQKGLGANHPHAQVEKQHPAPFSFQDVEQLILFFTKKGQKVLDPKTKKRVQEGLATNYSNDKRDLANIDDYRDFLIQLKDIFIKSARVLKENKYMCIIVSDFRNQSEFVRFHSDII